MKLIERAEEILETLWIEQFEKNNKGCNASLLKDDEAVQILENDRYVKIKNDIMSLTIKGTEEAKNCVRRHRLAERLLVDVLDVRGGVHEVSCKFEHLLHKGIDDHICTLLGHPRTCPHGKNIPEGPCCKDLKRQPKKIIMSLSDIKPGTRARIAYLQSKDHNTLQKAIAMGALPGTKIKLVQKFPSFVFEVGKSQFAIDKELAAHIFVRVI